MFFAFDEMASYVETEHLSRYTSFNGAPTTRLNSEDRGEDIANHKALII